VPEIEALAKAEGYRWNREARLAAWMIQASLPHLATAVALGIAACFGKDAQLPRLMEWDEMLKTLPDYLREPDGEG
jgi:hypothetical protein